MTFAQNCMKRFEETVELYHMTDDVDAVLNNPYPAATIENTLVRKNWIDAVQWHLEDIIRDPDIDPVQVATVCISIWDGLVHSRIARLLQCDMEDTLRKAYDAVWASIRTAGG